MKSATARILSLVLLILVASAVGCGGSTESPSAEPGSPSSPASGTPGPTGTITASPNPIPVCNASGVGVTHLAWAAPPGIAVQVRVGKPDGALFASTGNVGEKDTGKWVGEGARFYLVRASGPGAPPSVLGSTVVHVTKDGCR